jgi:hypothetical protein
MLFCLEESSMGRKFLVVLSISAVAFICACKKEQKITLVGFVVQSYIGDVKIEHGGVSAVPVIGQTLTTDDAVVTGKTSVIDVLCSNEGVVRLNELSRLSIASLVQSTENVNVTLRLESGKVFASFAKMKKDSSLQVKTQTAIAAVRGTSFRVSADDKKSSVEVLSGKVQVNPVKDDVVVDAVSSVVEENKSTEISVKDVKAISESKKEIKVSNLKPEMREEIKTESAGISVSKNAPAELKTELDTVGIKSIEVEVKPIPAEAVKDKPVEEKAVEAMPAENKAAKPSPTAVKKDDRAEKALKEKNEKERIEKERIENEKAEAAEKEKAEKIRVEREKTEKAEKAKEQKESRVKNIPNI